MRLIYDNQIIILEKVHKTIWGFPFFRSIHVSGIIFNPGTKTCFPKHFHIKIGSFGNSLSFNQFIFRFKEAYSFFAFFFNRFTCLVNLFLWNYIMRSRKNCHMLQGCMFFTGKRVYLHNTINLISEKFHANQIIPSFCRIYFHYIPPHTESTSSHIQIISGILNIN